MATTNHYRTRSRKSRLVGENHSNSSRYENDEPDVAKVHSSPAFNAPSKPEVADDGHFPPSLLKPDDNHGKYSRRTNEVGEHLVKQIFPAKHNLIWRRREELSTTEDRECLDILIYLQRYEYSDGKNGQIFLYRRGINGHMVLVEVSEINLIPFESSIIINFNPKQFPRKDLKLSPDS
ncbi:hypothetical protein TNCV_80601 [Trichonephila clavipes]|nr:hypothetical protein TNCV_80601 [Trichonephila clavipes]